MSLWHDHVRIYKSESDFTDSSFLSEQVYKAKDGDENIWLKKRKDQGTFMDSQHLMWTNKGFMYSYGLKCELCCTSLQFKWHIFIFYLGKGFSLLN